MKKFKSKQTRINRLTQSALLAGSMLLSIEASAGPGERESARDEDRSESRSREAEKRREVDRMRMISEIVQTLLTGDTGCGAGAAYERDRMEREDRGTRGGGRVERGQGGGLPEW
ncbi:MAG: hypothetical protein HRU19_28400 [Pseudobacteriovorax sp.]|nr:hypothetical protein [Pseudobacteriovorax sp.]